MSERVYLPKQVKDDNLDYLENPKEFYESFGITNITDKYKDTFEADLPENWTAECSGYWTSIKDETGKCRISIFQKSCPWDYDYFARKG